MLHGAITAHPYEMGYKPLFFRYTIQVQWMGGYKVTHLFRSVVFVTVTCVTFLAGTCAERLLSRMGFGERTAFQASMICRMFGEGEIWGGTYLRGLSWELGISPAGIAFRAFFELLLEFHFAFSIISTSFLYFI